MSTTSTPPPKINTIPPFPYANLLDGVPFPDWRQQLHDDGYAVIPAIPRERALEYRQRAFDWLEGYGLDREDPSTFRQEKLPLFSRGGMYGGNSYGFGQAQWVWDIRTEPGVLAAFELLWGTEKLVCSFDGGSLMLPGQASKPKPGEDSSWQHIDQSPSRVGFFVAQGLVNLNDNGPDDGGLLVMKGSSRLMTKFFDLHGRPPIPDERIDWHKFTNEQKQWFLDQGCEWIKVDAGPGDLILWDSSTMHQNRPPSGTRDRMVTYVCMGPADLLTEEDKSVRAKAFREQRGTTHTPFHGCHSFPLPTILPFHPGTGLPDEAFVKAKDPVMPTEQVEKLAGVRAY